MLSEMSFLESLKGFLANNISNKIIPKLHMIVGKLKFWMLNVSGSDAKGALSSLLCCYNSNSSELPKTISFISALVDYSVNKMFSDLRSLYGTDLSNKASRPLQIYLNQ